MWCHRFVKKKPNDQCAFMCVWFFQLVVCVRVRSMTCLCCVLSGVVACATVVCSLCVAPWNCSPYANDAISVVSSYLIVIPCLHVRLLGVLTRHSLPLLFYEAPSSCVDVLRLAGLGVVYVPSDESIARMVSIGAPKHVVEDVPVPVAVSMLDASAIVEW